MNAARDLLIRADQQGMAINICHLEAFCKDENELLSELAFARSWGIQVIDNSGILAHLADNTPQMGTIRPFSGKSRRF